MILRTIALQSIVLILLFLCCTNNNACGLILVETIKEGSCSPCFAVRHILLKSVPRTCMFASNR